MLSFMIRYPSNIIPNSIKIHNLNNFFKKPLAFYFKVCYNQFCQLRKQHFTIEHAGVAELADAQDLKSCG